MKVRISGVILLVSCVAAMRAQTAIDFSHAGYGGGGVAAPIVAAVISVAPTGRDDTALLQGAIDQVSGLPLRSDGFRGAILLGAGRYVVAGRLQIRAAGVVLRGSGSAVIVAAGKGRRTLIEIGNTSNPVTEAAIPVADETVAAGALTLRLENLGTLRPGDRVIVTRPSNRAWISDLKMTGLPGSYANLRLDWAPGSRDLIWDRTVAAVDPARRQITLDAPITTALETRYGGGTVARVASNIPPAHIGIEDLTLESQVDPGNPRDEEHSWIAVALDRVEDAFVRRVVARRFAGSAVRVGPRARRVTVEACRSEQPVSEPAGYRRLSFLVEGQQTLIRECHSELGMNDLIAALLYLFPYRFRSAFGADMLTTFDDRWRDEPGWRLASRTVLDLAVAAAREQFVWRPKPALDPQGDKLMTILWQDLRFALRTLARSRGFTLVALATLALGIGINTAMFSVAHSVLWRSLPYPQPDRLVMVGEVDAHDPDSFWGASYPNLRDWRARSTSFEHLAGVMTDSRVLREGPEPVRISGLAVSHEFFDAMGVAPSMGRVFTESEDRVGAAPVIVLSHRMWTERLGADPGMLGRSIRFAGVPFTVIGVMPAGFEYRQAEYWTPLDQFIGPHFASHRNIWVLSAVGRLRAGQSTANAQKEVEAIAAQIRHDYPESRRNGMVVRVAPLRDELSRDLRPALLVLLGAVGFVLLIVCSNLAGLMLVRGASRAREMAIRSALGVGSGRLVRQLLTESALLASFGGLAGIALAFWATRSIGLLTADPRLLDVHIDGAVLAFAAIVTAATTVLFGIAPAIRATRVDAGDALKSGSRGAGASERAISQRVLVVSEVALCLVLLAGSGLLLRSFQRVFEVNPGFRPDGLVSLRVGLPVNYNTVALVKQFYEHLNDRLAVLPGVSGVTIGSQLPISGGEGNGDISIEDRPSGEGELGASTFRHVMPNYFEVMGIPLVRGRVFDKRDDGSTGRVAIVNEGFARRFWPDADPIGKRFRIGPRDTSVWLTVVGVVADVRQIRLDLPAPFSSYEPLAVGPEGRFEVAVRASGDPRRVIASVRAELRAMEPALLVDKVQTMSERIGDTVSPRRLNLLLFGLFAALALLLAAVGLYGVVAYAAGQRTQEFGIRMALGAQPRDVLRLVLGEGLKLALTGVAIGIVAALSLARLMAGLLFGIEPHDPVTLAGVAVLLSLVALAACWLPAHRATRIAPVEALHSE